jgi:NitT/TauT family transport system substrate-binding protein
MKCRARVRWFPALTVLLALTLALVGSTPAQQAKRVRLAYGVAAVDPSTAPWLSAAKTGGFWQEEGLDVQVTGFNGSGPALQLLASGQVEAVFTGTPDLFRLREEGLPIRVVASVYDRNHIYPVVLPDSPIQKIEDFKGKRMGVQTLTGAIPLWTKVLLQSHGLTMNDMAAVIPVGTGAPAVHALKSGQVDVLTEWHGHYALLETQFGINFRKFDKDPSLAQNSFVQGFFVRDDLIQKDPQLVAGLLRGVAKGIILARENPRAAARGHFEQFPRTQPTGTSPEEALERTAKIISINVELSTQSSQARRWGLATPANVERVRDVLLEAGVVKKKLEWQQYYTPEFIDKANGFDADTVIRRVKAL